MKNKKILLVIVLLVTLFTISIINIKNIKAIEKNIVNITLSESGESSPPLFNIRDGYMHPGADINKDFVLKNTTPRKYRIEKIRLENFNIKDINGKKLDVTTSSDLKIIEEFYESFQCSLSCEGIFNNEILYSDDIKQLIKGKILQSDISILSGNEKKFNVIISMKTSAGNNMQGLQANFNIVFNAIDINGGTVVDPPVQPPVNPPVQPVDPSQPPVNPPIEIPGQPPIQPPVDNPTNPPIANPGIPGNPGTVIDSPQDSDSLVQTGSPIDTTTLLVLGLIFIGTGFKISFSKKEQ